MIFRLVSALTALLALLSHPAAARHGAKRARSATRADVPQPAVRAPQFEWSAPRSVWPQPASLATDAGACGALAPGGVTISTTPGSFANDVTAAAAKRYEAILLSYGATGPTDAPPAGMPVLAAVSVTVTSSDDDLRFGIDESYNLTVEVITPGAVSATIYAATSFGAVWGLETLAQLTHRVWTADEGGRLNNSYYRVCATTVVDAPRFPFRSLLLDTSRHFMTPQVIYQVIDVMSALKMNALHLHLTDDQSWPLYVPELPIITNKTAYSPVSIYTSDDLRAIVQFGRLRGVVVCE